jgi:DNA helicase-2/ATP-dependent DNA helicase PcrA
VGITRARERLVISRAARRLLHGSIEPREPSRFLEELPAEVVQYAGASAGGKARPAQPDATRWDTRRTASVARAEPPRTRVLSRGGEAGAPSDDDSGAAEFGFRAGDKVTHGTFGAGVVVSALAKDGDEEVTVAFAGIGVKKLLASFARLERA